MAPSMNESNTVNSVIYYMGDSTIAFSPQSMKRCFERIAKSPACKDFVLQISKQAPSIMTPILKDASLECATALQQELDDDKVKKRDVRKPSPARKAKRCKLGAGKKSSNLPTQAKGSEIMDEGTASTVEQSDDEILSDATSTVEPPASFSASSNGGRPGDAIRKRSRRYSNQSPPSSAPGKLPDVQQGILVATRRDSSVRQIGIKPVITYSGEFESPELVEDDVGGEAPDKSLTAMTHGLQAIDRGRSPKLITDYEKEVGITRGTRDVTDSIKAYCFERFGHTHNKARQWEQMGEVCDNGRKLDSRVVKSKLVTFMENRLQKSGNRKKTPSTWDMSDPSEIYGALQEIHSTSQDASIHRAYGQMKLFLSVNAKAESGYKLKIDTRRVRMSLWGDILDELAVLRAGRVSRDEIERTISSYHTEYHAGEKWLDVATWFGGDNIVIFFVLAGIGSSYVASSWTDLQRRC
ncbi:hypothetical protein MMC28_005935 [Mycoblastus sanguinarius]|nr:hypothetical protein [Mycoblastus sanguinarius]